MNIRKAVDYSTMFATLESVMKAYLPQMELYCEIGKAVCAHSEKGAAVAAAEFIKEQYPDMTGFSPRNVRRMRDFWQLYSGMPELLGEALHLNWTQNVVIMEAELTAVERRWYIRQATARNLSKAELLRMIEDSAYLESVLDEKVDVWYNEGNDEISERTQYEEDPVYLSRQYLPQPNGGIRDEGLGKKAGLASQFHIESAATSREEIGNPVYPPARRKLAEHGISCEGHAARQLTNRDYDEYDLLIGMDQANLRDMYRICGGDYVGKMSLLMDHTAHPGNVADPWYTEDFEATWQDVLDGCQGLLKEFMTERGDSNGTKR